MQRSKEELAALAEKAKALQEESERLFGKPRPKRTGNIFYTRPPVKRVKGYDVSAERAEHKRRQRAKRLARRKAKPPIRVMGRGLVG